MFAVVSVKLVHTAYIFEYLHSIENSLIEIRFKLQYNTTDTK